MSHTDSGRIEIAPGEALELALTWEAPHPTLPDTWVPVDGTGMVLAAELRVASGIVPIGVAWTDATQGALEVVAMPAATETIGKAGVALWVSATPANGRKRWIVKGENLKVIT